MVTTDDIFDTYQLRVGQLKSLSLLANRPSCAYQCGPDRHLTDTLCFKVFCGQGLVPVSHEFRILSSPTHGVQSYLRIARGLLAHPQRAYSAQHVADSHRR